MIILGKVQKPLSIVQIPNPFISGSVCKEFLSQFALIIIVQVHIVHTPAAPTMHKTREVVILCMYLNPFIHKPHILHYTIGYTPNFSQFSTLNSISM